MKNGSILAILIISIAIAVIISTYSNSSSYGSFSEARSTKAELHIISRLDKSKPLIYDPVKDANLFSFFMVDKNGQECRVDYTGTKPQDFERSEQIVLTGQMSGNVFNASRILMKCPSKYTNKTLELTENK
jgi:cytochrome c-type biogenesis protein CcmE